MFKITAIVLTIAASSTTAVIRSAAPISGATADGQTTQAVQRVYFESTRCRTAKRQVAVYSRALNRLDMSSAPDRQKALLYRQFRQTERDWYVQNCRVFLQTAVDNNGGDTP